MTEYDADLKEWAEQIWAAVEYRGDGVNELKKIANRFKAEALRDAATTVRYELGTEASGHTSTYSVRVWLNSQAERFEKGAR